jgi:hypothetical protein
MLQILLGRDVGGHGDGGAVAVSPVDGVAQLRRRPPACVTEMTTLGACSAMRSAMARPMPREEPVMMATLPASENKDMGCLLTA